MQRPHAAHGAAGAAVTVPAPAEGDALGTGCAPAAAAAATAAGAATHLLPSTRLERLRQLMLRHGQAQPVQSRHGVVARRLQQRLQTQTHAAAVAASAACISDIGSGSGIRSNTGGGRR